MIKLRIFSIAQSQTQNQLKLKLMKNIIEQLSMK